MHACANVHLSSSHNCYTLHVILCLSWLGHIYRSCVVCVTLRYMTLSLHCCSIESCITLFVCSYMCTWQSPCQTSPTWYHWQPQFSIYNSYMDLTLLTTPHMPHTCLTPITNPYTHISSSHTPNLSHLCIYPKDLI